MFDAGFSLTSLRDCLAHVEPVKLLGMDLLQAHSPLPQGHWFPVAVPRNLLIDAVTELVGYTRRCVYAAEQISRLAPVPLASVSIWEFGL